MRSRGKGLGGGLGIASSRLLLVAAPLAFVVAAAPACAGSAGYRPTEARTGGIGTEAGATGMSLAGQDCAGDRVAPRLTSLTLSRTEVDVTDGPARVRVIASADDFAASGIEPSGVQKIRLTMLGWHDRQAKAYLRPTADGSAVWSGSLLVAWGATPATWLLDEVLLVDKAGNSYAYGRALDQEGPATVPGTWNGLLVVTDRRPDRRAPTVEAISVSPRYVDTRAHRRIVRIEARVTDDRAVVGVFATLVLHYDSDGQKSLDVTLVRRRGALFAASVTVPRWNATGLWSTQLWARDANRVRALNPVDIARRGWPTTVDVISRELSRISISGVRFGSPRQTADGGYRVAARVTVDGHGMALREVDGALSRPTSPRVYESALRLVRGDRTHGTWRGQVEVTRCASPGDYRPELWVQGPDRRWRWFQNYGLRRAGGPATISMPGLTGDDVPPEATWANAGSDHLVVRFSEGVRDVSPALTIIDGVTGRDVATTSMVCTTAQNSTVPCDTDDPVVRRVDFYLPPDVDSPVVRMNRLEPLPQVTDWFGNPLESVTA